jgi:quercetin dioxygenase-like cupin family protein
MNKNVIIAAAIAATATFATGIFASEDAVVADPGHYAVEFENDQVRIIRIKYGPGEKSVMHTHGPNASIILTDSKMRMTSAEGSSEVVEMKAGDVAWADADEHLPVNLSDEPVEVVLVELKK